MGALDILNMTEEARTHIEILTELLRDVDLEKRMETIIKAENFLKGDEMTPNQLRWIKKDLEEDMIKMQKMIFMVDRAQGLLNPNIV